jgi:hypothetical protein
MAGINPINIAELVNWETNKGKIVVKDAKPNPKPKKDASRTFTRKLYLKFLRTNGVEIMMRL